MQVKLTLYLALNHFPLFQIQLTSSSSSIKLYNLKFKTKYSIMSRPLLSNKPILISKANSYPKIKCAFHPDKYLTNFCLSKECLLPLCPQCVKLHTEEHSISYTHGKFEIFNECLQTVEKNYMSYIQQTKTLMKSVEQSYERKDKQQKYIRDVFQQSRKKILNEINSALNIYQQKMQDMLNSQMVQFRRSVEDLQTSITWVIGTSRKALQNLYTTQSASTLIQFYSEECEKIQNLLEINNKMDIGRKILSDQFGINHRSFCEIKRVIFQSLNILDKLNLKEVAGYSMRSSRRQQKSSQRKLKDSDNIYEYTALQNFDLRKYREERRNIHTSR